MLPCDLLHPQGKSSVTSQANSASLYHGRLTKWSKTKCCVCFIPTLTSCSCLRSNSRISWLRITATCCGWLLHLLQIPCCVSSSHTGQCKVVKYWEIVPFRPSSSVRAVEAAFWIYKKNFKWWGTQVNNYIYAWVIHHISKVYTFNRICRAWAHMLVINKNCN